MLFCRLLEFLVVGEILNKKRIFYIWLEGEDDGAVFKHESDFLNGNVFISRL